MNFPVLTIEAAEQAEIEVLLTVAIIAPIVSGPPCSAGPLLESSPGNLFDPGLGHASADAKGRHTPIS